MGQEHRLIIVILDPTAHDAAVAFPFKVFFVWLIITSHRTLAIDLHCFERAAVVRNLQSCGRDPIV